MSSFPPVIGLNGVSESGKDTVAQILNDLYGYQRVAFADVLKAVVLDSHARVEPAPAIGWTVDIREFVKNAGGWQQAKANPNVRSLLQGVGLAVRDHIHPDIWVDAVFFDAPKGSLVISDMRFPNEYAKVRNRGGVTWRINRPGKEAALGHISDTALDGHVFDQYLDNDGSIGDLSKTVRCAMGYLGE